MRCLIGSLILEQYRNHSDSYKIEYNRVGDQSLCVIYFSSHAIYFPNTQEEFIRNLQEKDKYEWYKMRHLNAGMHIFVRDVLKQWYLNGINSTVNSIESLCELLRSLTYGKRIICIGASAGGYAAILLGCLLNAEKVIAFNPQINLDYELQNSVESENPLLFRYKDTNARKYFDLNGFMECNTHIYYVYSSLSKWDNCQVALMKHRDNIKVISIKSDHHGVPIPKIILQEFISANDRVFLRFTKKTARPVCIMLHINLRKTLSWYLKAYAKICKDKLCL